MSAAQLGTLAKLAAGTLDAADRMSTDEPAAANGAGAALEELTMADFRSTAGKANGKVDVPEGVIDLLTGVRNYLQARCAALRCPLVLWQLACVWQGRRGPRLGASLQPLLQPCASRC